MGLAKVGLAEAEENADGNNLNEDRRNVPVADAFAGYDRRSFEILSKLLWICTAHATVAIRIETLEFLIQ